ncbi:hypothetical protein [Acaryochloris sp. CCMEE 5410]|uniref:hypothetical protein n=1 Tax=Acaryochloris sp. CCMEE 5410 TaxID=310037 RepID=UPI0021CFDAD5|nr:hypothetical protein [Acaryochloris sp. CCMEE 5410]
MSQPLPSLTVSRSFMAEFIEAEKPCCALGMVVVEDRQCGFVALRPEPMIPPGATDLGFNFGHTLFGTSTYEVIHFAFNFYGFLTFNVLINPNNAIAKTVLQLMINTKDYFFFAIDEETGIATAFRSQIGNDTLLGLTETGSGLRIPLRRKTNTIR